MLKRKTRSLYLLLLLLTTFLVAGTLRDSVVEADQSDSKIVTVYADGNKSTVSTKVATVSELLSEMGIAVDSNDKISQPLTAMLTDDMNITIKKVEVKEVTKVEPIPFETLNSFSRVQTHGTKKVIQKGVNGEKTVTYKVTLIDGKETSKQKLSSVITKKSIPCKVSIGSRGASVTSRGESYRYRRSLTMTATAYAAESFRGSRTATGTRAEYGIAAVDPRVIPLGTKLYVEGYGFALAADTGGAIKGNRIDLVLNTVRECLSFGRKKLKVHILER